jgi:hypothetical protein
MSRADVLSESLIHRLEAQLGPLGVDVRIHAANVREMVERLPDQVENPAGLLVSWCQRDADARRSAHAKRERDQERYAELMVDLYAWIAAAGPGPRIVARVLDQASREGYPALNRRTIEKLRALGSHWPAPAGHDEGPNGTGATDSATRPQQLNGPGRSDARVRT